MRKIRRRTFYKIGAVAFFMGLGLILFFRQPEDVDKETKIKIMERSIRSPLNQGECRHPHLPIDNPDIMQFYKPVKKINCGNSLDEWVTCEKSICFVKPEISASHGEVICSYTDLVRKSDYRVKYGKTTKTKEPYVLQESDFVRVICRGESGQSWSGMAYGIRDTVQRSIPPNLSPPLGAPIGIADNALGDTPPFFNVLMFGFDSLSRNAFMRKLPKSYAYLTQQLHSVVLTGYNIVGDGTPQALVPLLTGFTELELPETRTRMSNAFNVDVYPMIWKDYERQGYVTSFNEDVPNIGTFTYRMTGFDKQPVDHYLRTFYLEAQNLLVSECQFCIGHRPDHVVMLDYTKNFMAKYSGAPRFVFSFHGSLSHDSINWIGAADDDVLEWLSNLKEKHLLDNTILIFMADHGNRFSEVRATLQGKQEERLPFFSFSFPEAFQKRFPEQYSNFVQNSERLTTPFDVHATLKDILKIQTADAQPSQQQQSAVDLSPYDEAPAAPEVANEEPQIATIRLSELARKRAISLFDIIPANRSCGEAYIEPHWCACLNWQQLPLNDTDHTGTLLKMSASIVDTINNATNHYRSLCAPLELHKINWAMRLLPHKEMLHFKSNSDTDGFLGDFSGKTRMNEELYQLQIVVNPGESLFEASVAYNLHSFSAITKLSEISRINKYGTQANCIYERDPELRKYCYCRT